MKYPPLPPPLPPPKKKSSLLGQSISTFRKALHHAIDFLTVYHQEKKTSGYPGKLQTGRRADKYHLIGPFVYRGPIIDKYFSFCKHLGKIRKITNKKLIC